MSIVLVVNSGSSSFKYQLLDMEAETVLASGLVERIGEPSAGSGTGGHSSHTVTAAGMREPVAESFDGSTPAPTVLDATYTRDLPIPDHTAGFAVMLEAFAQNGPSLTERPPV
ncbi:MAG: acetate kinase, partial [Microbacterium pygmaeum]